MPASFSVGDIVRVRSREHIASGLDPLGRRKSCLMTAQMWDYCCQTFKIVKVISNFFDENQYEMFEVRSPIYILEDLVCDGVSATEGDRCDRSCHLFRHADWLQSVDSGLR